MENLIEKVRGFFISAWKVCLKTFKNPYFYSLIPIPIYIIFTTLFERYDKPKLKDKEEEEIEKMKSI